MSDLLSIIFSVVAIFLALIIMSYNFIYLKEVAEVKKTIGIDSPIFVGRLLRITIVIAFFILFFSVLLLLPIIF